MGKGYSVVESLLLQASANCSPPPPVLGWVLVGTALVAALLQFLFRRRPDPLWQLIAAIQPAMLLILGLLTLADVPWHCSIVGGDYLFLRISSLLLVVAGILMVIAGALQLWRGTASKHWPTAPGRVLSSEVKTHRTTKGMWHEPKIRYEYWVDGIHHGGKRVAFGQSRYRYEDEARQVVDAYPAGKEIQARHTPNRRSVSTLEPGVQNGWMMLVVTVLGVVVAGSGLFLLFAEIEPSSGGSNSRSGSVAENGPYGLIALVFILAVVGGAFWWTHRRKGDFNPWVPTAVVAAAIPVWFALMELGDDGPFRLRPVGMLVLIVGWLVYTLVMYAAFASYARVRRRRGSGQGAS